MSASTIITTRNNRFFFTETEAALELGVSLDRFRDLVRTHITQNEDEVNNIGVTTYQSSDLLVLKLLAKFPVHR